MGQLKQTKFGGILGASQEDRLHLRQLHSQLQQLIHAAGGLKVAGC